MAYRTTSWKNTDIGKIPSDWELNLFKNTFTKYPTNSFTRDEMNDFGGSFQNIHYGDILIKYGEILDFNKCQVPYLNSFISKTYKTIQNGDIIIADTAEDETVGKCVEIYNLPQNIKVLSGMHTMFCRPTNYFYPRFLGYYMNSHIYHNQLLPYITGTKVSAVSKTDIDKTYILEPPISEQLKIAEALTDIDDLIAELERVRDKKIAIKTGAMQELLTGKRRLPGFNKPWKEVELGKICFIKTGKKDVNEGSSIGQYPFFTCAKEHTFADTFSYDTEAILIAGNGEVGHCKYYIGKFEVYQRTYVLFNSAINMKYQFQYLKYFFQKYIQDEIQQGAMPYIKLGTLTGFNMNIPADVEEQSAIVKILNDMDYEISAINDKINKYKQIKSGVAGELLSGRIRLVKPQE